ncbi:hypothetical protein MAIT1_01726 [Magnetofaba australis IT-1]|uniref:Uncharacterized protein n=2 Tax=Magnetofaba TaxID=1472292 RepID=A0A1Y2K3U5_9PROT|nr:hypothetical protein MAIT1_01726 [Magnetofaba australis IT-1]
MLLGGLFIIWRLPPAIRQVDAFPMLWQTIVWRTGFLFLFSVACASACLGVVVFARPSTLKRLEQWLNEPVSLAPVKSTLARMRRDLHGAIQRHVRLAGFIMLVGGLGACLLLYRWVFHVY